MVNYYAFASSNYFRVKDERKFSNLCKRYGFEKIKNNKGKVGFTASSEDGLPRAANHSLFEIAGLLKPGEIAIVAQIGWEERLRFLTGSATAINHKQQTKHVDLTQIYGLSKKLLGDAK